MQTALLVFGIGFAALMAAVTDAFSSPATFVHSRNQVGHSRHSVRLFAGMAWDNNDNNGNGAFGAVNILEDVRKLERELDNADAPVNQEQIKSLLNIVDRLLTEAATTANGSTADAFATAVPPKLSKKSDVLKLIDGLLVAKPSLQDVRKQAGLPVDDERDGIQSLLELRESILDLSEASSAEEDLGYQRYPRHPEYPNVSLENMPKMRAEGVTSPPPLEYFFSMRRILGTIKAVASLVFGLRLNAAQVAAAPTARERSEAWFSSDTIRGGAFLVPNPFKGLVPKPHRLIQNYQSDQEFARQYLAGTNPVSIRVCTDPSTQLTPALLRYCHEHDVEVERLVAEKRLLYADYHELNAVKDNPRSALPKTLNPDIAESDDNLRYFEAPIIVFELHPNRNDMGIVAIQLKQDNNEEDDEDESPEVYSRSTCSEAEWFMAKLLVANADANVHEFLNHLFETHLALEGVVVALHNTIKKFKHPLWDFFQPITKDALFLNFSSRNLLFTASPRSFSDECVSVGVGQLCQLIQNRWQKYDFFVNAHLPNELAARGFGPDTDMPGYLFREDGLKLWDALGEFTTHLVDEVYRTDQDVAKDIVLRLWADEMTDPEKCGMPGFPTSFEDKATLATALQCLWWVASCLHNALNAPQYDYYAFAPNKPLTLRMNMEQFKERGDDTLDYVFEHVLPDDACQLNTLMVSRMLTLPADVHLDDLSGHYNSKKTRYGQKSYQRFQRRLRVIGDAIDRRNQRSAARGEATYPYLHPSVVAASPRD